MMKIKLLFLFSFCLSVVFSQSKCDQVLLTGKVVDSLNPQSFYNLMIVNRTKGKGVFGQPNGRFSVYVSENDSISISVKGYKTLGFRIHADADCQFKYSKYIDPIAVEMKEVVIKPLKTLEQIKEERQELSMRETRQVTGIDAMQSPITALYQTFSKKEKNKRWIAEQEFKDNERKVVQELLRLYVAYDIINLTEEEFDDFITFLNINETFLKTATEMELITFVQDKFEHYKRMNNLTFDENNKWRTEIKRNEKSGIVELLNLYNKHGIIDLPEYEFDRFIKFMKIDDSFLNSSDSEVASLVQSKYKRYIDFYKLNFTNDVSRYNITIYDNYLWQSELACKDNKKSAVKVLLSIYISHGVIALPQKEIDRFITFLNLSESFMKSASDSQLINFVQDKFVRYIDFYKINLNAND